MYASTIFNSQQLLFDKSRRLDKSNSLEIPEAFYEHGWAVVDGGANAQDAIEIQEHFIRNIDPKRLPLQANFAGRIQLAKADQIPVCDDIVTTAFQVLHFDMGQPFLQHADDAQLLITHVGIYLPKSTSQNVTARTRVVELKGLLAHKKMSRNEIEQSLLRYVRRYGDGWKGHNTYRLACFARFLDSLTDKHELSEQIDKTVGQWFQSSKKLDAEVAYNNEKNFYQKHGIELREFERRIALEPGQLLILDNMRVIHGRIGERKAKELYNFMFGIQAATNEDIKKLRHSICNLVVKH